MNADKGSPDALVVEPRTTPATNSRPTQSTQPEQTRGRSSSKAVGMLAAAVVAALVALGVWASTRPATTPETVAPAQVHHDSGITQAVRERNETLQAHRDSGIAQAVRERNQTLQAHRDSGIEQALRERSETLEAHRDSGITQALREREQTGQSPPAP